MSPEFPFLTPLEKDGSVSAWEKLDSGPLLKFVRPVSGGGVPEGHVPASWTPPHPPGHKASFGSRSPPEPA